LVLLFEIGTRGKTLRPTFVEVFAGDTSVGLRL
jgi:hypothetical protein